MKKILHFKTGWSHTFHHRKTLPVNPIKAKYCLACLPHRDQRLTPNHHFPPQFITFRKETALLECTCIIIPTQIHLKGIKSAPSPALESHMAVTKTSFNARATLNICNKNLTVTSRSSNQDKRLWCDLLTVRKLLVAGLGWKNSLHHVEEAQVNRQRSEELSCLSHRLITAHRKREKIKMELLGRARSYSKSIILPKSQEAEETTLTS